MTDMIRSFDESKAEQRLFAGGKGGTLAQLYQAGYPVPDGFVILPSAFAGNVLDPEAWLQTQVRIQKIRHLNSDPAFAIRSSALSEDSAQASFAGEFETVLDVRTNGEIYDAIHTVHQSRQSERVEAYSQAQGMDPGHDVAVVVQQLVRAEISGVLFTADPVTGNRLAMVGNFVYGLGERLVSGQVDALTFKFTRPKGQYDGPPDLKHYARKLYKLAVRLEDELGCPQDVEWAIANGKLYLLQSRPITTLIGHNPATGAWNESLTGDYLWSNVNFGEAVPDVMSPCTWSALQIFRREWVSLPGIPPFGNIGGRLYLNISYFASMLNAIGKSEGQLREALEGALHMPLPDEINIPVVPLSKRTTLSVVPRMLWRQVQEQRVAQALPAFFATNPAWCRDMRQLLVRIEKKDDLLHVWEKEIKPHSIQAYTGVLSSAMRFMNYTTPIRQELIRLVGPDNANTLLSNLSGDEELLASLGPIVGLAKVARGEMQHKAYIEQYGHRGPREWELSVPRSAEEPAWLEAKLAEFRQSAVDVEKLLARQRQNFVDAWQHFQERYPRKAKSMRHRIDEAGARARLRENARSEFVRVAWVLRTWALRVGELTDLGEDVFFLSIDEVLDLLAGDEAAAPVATASIPNRKETYEKYRALPPYPAIINGRFDPFQWAADPNRSSEIFDSHAPITRSTSAGIAGSAGSMGRVEGVVRILDSLEEGDQLQPGEILVTAQTDIGWTLLFPRAAAIVTDVGAPLSHAAIVARELGIPAVVGCGNATRRLHTGDRIRVDGGQGVVEIL